MFAIHSVSVFGPGGMPCLAFQTSMNFSRIADRAGIENPFMSWELSAAFFYSADREGIHPERHLAGFAGILQADAYGGFGRLYAPGRRPSPILEAACWAHARRKLYELAAVSKVPIAAEAVRRIDRLFAVERDTAGLSAEARLAVRLEKSAPILADLEPWLRRQQGRLSRKSEVGKAIAYTTKRWEALTIDRAAVDHGRRPDLSHEQRGRAGAARRGGWPAQLDLCRLRPRWRAGGGDLYPDRDL
jgi:transposase